jgi:hypothetical protein
MIANALKSINAEDSSIGANIQAWWLASMTS